MKDQVFLFDIGNVLLDFSFTPLQKKIAQDTQVTLPEVQAQWSDPSYIEVETGRMDEQVYFHRFCQRTGLTWTFDHWIDQWAQIFRPNPRMHGLYLDVQRQGYHAAMLSNLGPHHVKAIERGNPGFFAAGGPHFFSFELGLHKPDPAIYWTVSHKLNRSPQQCLFIDDTKENVEGAKSIGMPAMQCTPDNHDAIERFARSFM